MMETLLSSCEYRRSYGALAASWLSVFVFVFTVFRLLYAVESFRACHRFYDVPDMEALLCTTRTADCLSNKLPPERPLHTLVRLMLLLSLNRLIPVMVVYSCSPLCLSQTHVVSLATLYHPSSRHSHTYFSYWLLG